MTHDPQFNGDVGGYLIEEEDHDWIDSLPDETDILSLTGYTENLVSLDEIDPTAIIDVEDQRRTNSCQGHAASTVVEWLVMLATQNIDVKLSRWAAYRLSQEVNNLQHSDGGSTITAGCKVALDPGFPEESFWPFDGTFPGPSGKDGWRENARRYRAGGKRNMKSYDGLRKFLGAGLGGVNCGITWGPEMNQGVVKRFTGSEGGGHAVALLALDKQRRDSHGRPNILGVNSWTKNWGLSGWFSWEAAAVESMFMHRWTVMIGLMGQPNAKPQSYDLKTWMSRLNA